MKNISIIGAGSWGAALSILVAANADNTTLVARDEAAAAEINRSGQNKKYLPGIDLPENIRVTHKPGDLANTEAVFLAVPSKNIREICKGLKNSGIKKIPIVICAKGLEQGSLKLMSEVAAEELPENPAVILTGPNFADEIAKGLPAATVIASENRKIEDKEIAENIAALFNKTPLRPYISHDIIGAQIGGAAKNVIAVACGIAVGKGLGENAKAALITRGLAEITQLCLAKGGKAETIAGLAGLGDLVLTCSSLKSRNMFLGHRLGKDKTAKNTAEISDTGKTIEGITASVAIKELAEKLNVETPVSNAVYKILHANADIDETIKKLLERPIKQEF